MFQSRVPLILCLVILLLLSGSMTASAQRGEESEEASIALTTADASPGGVAYVSIRFDSSDTVSLIQQIQTTLCFPGNLLEFENFFLGPAAEAAGAEVTPHLEESAECTRLILPITFEAIPKPGLLGTLEFRVNLDAPTPSNVEIQAEAAFSGAEGRVATSADDVTFEIIEPVSVFACFFYMH